MCFIAVIQFLRGVNHPHTWVFPAEDLFHTIQLKDTWLVWVHTCGLSLSEAFKHTLGWNWAEEWVKLGTEGAHEANAPVKNILKVGRV